MERKRVIERMAQDEERRIVEVVRREDSSSPVLNAVRLCNPTGENE